MEALSGSRAVRDVDFALTGQRHRRIEPREASR
jgi:hypothetical protein